MEVGLDMQLPGHARLPDAASARADAVSGGYADVFSAIGNKFTGNLDWQRSEYQRLQNNAYNAQQAAIGRDFESKEAQKDRDWKERMSNTAYQRAAADMKTAGINPVALLGGAQSASTPSGSSAHAVAARSSGSSSFRSGDGFDTLARVAGLLISGGISSALQASKAASFSQFSASNRELARALNNFTFGKR